MKEREPDRKTTTTTDEKTLQRSYTPMAMVVRPFRWTTLKFSYGMVLGQMCVCMYVCMYGIETLCNMFLWCVLISEIYILFKLYLCFVSSYSALIITVLVVVAFFPGIFSLVFFIYSPTKHLFRLDANICWLEIETEL